MTPAASGRGTPTLHRPGSTDDSADGARASNGSLAQQSGDEELRVHSRDARREDGVPWHMRGRVQPTTPSSVFVTGVVKAIGTNWRTHKVC